jgi:hypothetical protein
MAMKNLWILSEERPKEEVIEQIILKFANDNNTDCNIDNIKI